MSGRDMVGIAQTGSGKTLAVSMLSQFHNPFCLFLFRGLLHFGLRQLFHGISERVAIAACNTCLGK